MHTRRWWITAAFVLLTLFGSFLWSQHSQTAILTVSNCSGDASVSGSLGFQIAAAASGDTIVYGQDCTTTVTATILVNKDITIDALSGTPHTVVLSGGSALTIMATRPNAANQPITLGLNGLTFQNGSTTTSGGAINNQMGATVTITNSTFLNNSASLFGGAIFNGGGHLNVTNSTFSGNQVTGASGSPTYIAGGAIFNSNAGFADIKSSTFTANIANPTPSPSSIATLGGAIATFHDGARTFTLTNTLVAGNTAGNCHGADLVSTQNAFASGGHNLIGVNSSLSGPGCSGADFTGIANGSNNDLVGTDASPINPLLGTRANYGGKTETFPLLPGSPAIDAGGATCPTGVTADQRGVARPKGAACDIGAFESQGFTMTKGTGDNQATSINTAFANPLTATVASTFNEPVQGGKVTFTGPVSGAGIQNSPVLSSIGAAGAVSQSLTANATPGGPYTVNVTASGVATGISFTSLTNVGPVTHFVVSAPASATAGTAFNFTVTAQDAVNNTVTGYTGTAHFTSTDAQATSGSGLPTDTPFVVGDNGVRTFSATLKTAGAQKITAMQVGSPSVTGDSNSITVAPGLITHFLVTAPANATANTAFNFTVKAQDLYNNTATGFAGTVHFTSTDPLATSGSGLPADYLFTTGSGMDNGVHTFSATLKTFGPRTITAMDASNPSTTGTSGTITVGAGAAASLVVAGPAAAKAGQPYTFTVTVKDGANNTKTDYTGTVKITMTDPVGRVAPPRTFKAADAGVASFTVVPNTDGATTVTATDTAVSSVTGHVDITVTGPAIFSVTASSYGTTPIAGPTTGGTTITIVGNGFAGTTGVTAGGVACTGVVVNPAGTQITCVTGPHPAATVDVVVTTPAGTATGAGAFTYVDPGTVPPPGSRPGPVVPGPVNPAPPSPGGPVVPGPVNPAPGPRP